MAGSTLALLYDASLDVRTSVSVGTYHRKTPVLVLDIRVVAANSAALSRRIHFVRVEQEIIELKRMFLKNAERRGRPELQL
jgi:hypothetical protein